MFIPLHSAVLVATISNQSCIKYSTSKYQYQYQQSK